MNQTGLIKKALVMLVVLTLALAAFPASAVCCACETCKSCECTASEGGKPATDGEKPATDGGKTSTDGDNSNPAPQPPVSKPSNNDGDGSDPDQTPTHTLRKGDGFYDTLLGSAIQARVYIDSPVMAMTTGAEVDASRASFENSFANKLRVIHFDKAGSFEKHIRLAAKLDLSGMDTANLVFYAYDSAGNKYSHMKAPVYSVDKNGYLHFTTAFAGDIIVSEGLLTK
jgi:hypothetical protein